MSKHNRSHRAPKARWNRSDLSAGDDQSAGHRHARLEHILTNEIELLIRDEVADVGLADVHVASVTLSPDGACARVAYVIEGLLAEEVAQQQRARAALERAGEFIRVRLASHLSLKRTPKLTFTFLGMVEPGSTLQSEGGES